MTNKGVNTEFPFWSLSLPGIFELTRSAENGLTDNEAITRLQLIPAGRKLPQWQKDVFLFLRQFKSPLVLMLVAAVVISSFIGARSDIFIILFILLATGLLSFFQERTAGLTIEQLQRIIHIKCTVIRGGISAEIAADTIVSGDIILVKAGDIVPADCFLTEGNELYVNEASLTGESFPVKKEPGTVNKNSPLPDRFNCLWEGSTIVSGTGRMIAVNTGKKTMFGNIAQSVSTVTETTFEKGIRRFGFFLMEVTLILAVIILAVNLFFHRPLFESLLFALALAVGMAPELLPAINTIAMSAGAKRMLKKKVVVKKLSAIQNLGEVNLLCTDKTGTITEGIIGVAGAVDVTGTENNFVRQLAYINARFESGYSNPIDEALKKMEMSLPADCEKMGEIPYDFIRKRLTIAVAQDKAYRLICKGAYKNILAICTEVRINEERNEPLADYSEQLDKIFAEYGNNGLRVISVCYKNISRPVISKDDEKEMIFAGFILLNDPLKEGLQDALQSLINLNVSVKIITGDNSIVAESIGKKIGLKDPVLLSGADLREISTEALIQQSMHTDIFAEVEPYQKERVIRALKKNFTVAYMGDGINDVTAINAADVGISTDNAVDVAKSAADFVLLERNLSVLADGIREGRKTFTNTLKYIFITTGATFGNMFSVACAALILPFLPMLPTQILLTNFLTDLPFLAVSMDKVDEEELRKNSRWNIKLIRNYMITFGLHSSIFDLTTFFILYTFLKVEESAFQTGWFMESVMTELIILFIMRTKRSFLKSRPSHLLLWLTVAAFFVTITLPWWPFANLFGMSKLEMRVVFALLVIILFYTLTADMLKAWFFKKMEKISLHAPHKIKI